jgi:hypothetical protein
MAAGRGQEVKEVQQVIILFQIIRESAVIFYCYNGFSNSNQYMKQLVTFFQIVNPELLRLMRHFESSSPSTP